MKYIIADTDEKSCVDLKNILDGYEMLDFQGSFITFKATENIIYNEPLDIAFISMENEEINAFRLASAIRELNPFSKVILLSSHESYAVEAFECGADGFLLAPFTREKVGKLLKKWMKK